MAWPFAKGSAFAAFEQGVDDQGRSTGARSWTSTDGMRWESAPASLPIDAGWGYPRVERGVSWLTTWDPGSLWRSSDGETWEQISVDGVVPDSPAAIEWDVELGGIASSEAVTAVEVTVRAREPFATLRWPEAISRLSEVEPGLYSIAGRDEGPPRLLRFEETPGGLSVTDEGDGAVILDDGKLVPTFDPGLVNESLGLSMVGLDDSIVAVVLAEPSGPAIVSRSSDGRNWEELGPWDITEGATGGTFYIGGSNGELHAEYHGPGPRVRSRRRGTPPAASTGSRSSIRHRPIRTS